MFAVRTTTDIQTAVDIIKCGARSGSPQLTFRAENISRLFPATVRGLQTWDTSECETFGGEPELLAAVHSMQQAVC